MSGKVVNLNKVRKNRDRAAKRVQADENAVKFGRTKAQRKLDKTKRAKADKHLDDHKTDE